MTARMISRVLFSTVLLASVTPAQADETKVSVASANAVQEALQSLSGKSVSLKPKSGEELSGKLAEVGPSAVRVSELKGMEFFDAVVKTEEIAAVVYRAK